MKETIIYIRTSTQEQDPKLQIKDCESLVKQLNLTNYEVLEEQKSAWKDNVEREVFNSIKKAIQNRQVKNLIVWDLDRLYRNRIKTVEFIKNYSKIGLKVYSYRQSWFQDIIKIPEPFNEIVYDLMVQLISWLGEEESKKKSERTKLAIVRDKGKPTMSYKGKKWGRKSIIKKLTPEVLKLSKEGLTLREIAQKVFYYDKNNNKKNISKSLVHNIIHQKD